MAKNRQSWSWRQFFPPLLLSILVLSKKQRMRNNSNKAIWIINSSYTTITVSYKQSITDDQRLIDYIRIYDFHEILQSSHFQFIVPDLFDIFRVPRNLFSSSFPPNYERNMRLAGHKAFE